MSLKILGILLSLLLVLPVIGCEDQVETDETAQEEEVKDKEEKSEEKNEDEEEEKDQEFEEKYQLGETIEKGDVEFTVHSVRWDDGSYLEDLGEEEKEMLQLPEGYDYLIAEIEIVNNADEQATLGIAQVFEASDDDGQIYDYSNVPETKDVVGPFAPGEAMEGEVAVEVPDDLSQYYLHFTPDVLGFEEAVVEIEADEIQ
ncbi:DUF4352 domain-containing protein [Natranaerobius thermophilus]|uniref:DUF4352 domain-containing protein n=1 Tax=Natranaerobius thermophilus (strain ATCC BAA-1301 / DSM 18059 / JW/NM-WN-LF) TaxID=457570 RepID=B2A0I0_NATTJ|nr:DUF4352 domain-containing protein [Natranaerobius thermophilus]ACB84541.1 hypothetical protein Nther_0957 [Natranaerobius thermophilus JW/NM-WN-LF]